MSVEVHPGELYPCPLRRAEEGNVTHRAPECTGAWDMSVCLRKCCSLPELNCAVGG